MTDEKLKLFRLYEKVSARGNRYFVGRLAGARVIVMRDERAEISEGTEGVWDVLLSPADEAPSRRAPNAPAAPRTAPRVAKADKPDPGRPFIEDELPPWTP